MKLKKWVVLALPLYCILILISFMM
jgi:hypothetical protein